MAYPKDLKPVTELGTGKPHGTRLKYMAGCKCMLCRAANSNYEAARKVERLSGRWNGIVPAAKARKHIIKLSKLGIGYKTVADIAGLACSTVAKIKSGTSKNLRAQNEKAILSVDRDALPDSALVSAKRTKQIIEWLRAEGFTEKEIAERLGYKNSFLQFNTEKITAKNALKVEKLFRQINIGAEEELPADSLERFLSDKL